MLALAVFECLAGSGSAAPDPSLDPSETHPMPTYEYRCKDCGHEFEINQAFTDDALTECPECQGALKKKFGSVGIAFKGSGFYKTDSRSTSSAGSAPSSGGTTSSGSEGGSSSAGKGDSAGGSGSSTDSGSGSASGSGSDSASSSSAPAKTDSSAKKSSSSSKESAPA